MDASLTFSMDGGIPPDSPCLDGHFPGNPIVPGAVILGCLANRLAGRGMAIERVERMKFTRPLGPATAFEMTLTRRPAGWRADFRDREGSFAAASLTLRAVRD